MDREGPPSQINASLITYESLNKLDQGQSGAPKSEMRSEMSVGCRVTMTEI